MNETLYSGHLSTFGHPRARLCSHSAEKQRILQPSPLISSPVKMARHPSYVPTLSFSCLIFSCGRHACSPEYHFLEEKKLTKLCFFLLSFLFF